MKRRIIYLVAILIFIFSSLSSASSKSFDYNKVKVNDQTFEYVAPSNLLINADNDRIKSLITKMAESLNALINWNDADKTIEVIKPNVQMITALKVGKDKENNLVVAGPFGKVKKGEKLEKFSVFTELQNLPEVSVNVRLLVVAPGDSTYGSDEFVSNPNVETISTPSSWISFEVKNAYFAKSGTYKLLLQMQLEGDNNPFVTIAQKEITCN